MGKTLGHMAAVCAISLCLFAGCGGSEEINTPAPVAPTTVTSTVQTKPMIDKDFKVLITQEELSDAVGIPMQEPDVTEQNSGIRSFSEESDQSRVMVDIAKADKTVFENRVLPGYTDLVACPNLGESAWFSAKYNHLLVYSDGYMMTVDLVIQGYDDASENMLRCRQIASIILERL
ncbi:MAG: hypothetical protein IKV35_02875 [Clostridia bacterium]|nr:hypothetical protein [Clostridia bacterium]